MNDIVHRSFVPAITSQDVQAASRAIQVEWGNDRNRSLNLLKTKLAMVVQKKYCLPVSHGTAAITVALAALNLDSGDEVIVPNLTWVACAAPIVQLGLKPVFVNVDNTLCLDPSELGAVLTKKTKAILAVDLAGSLPNWPDILSIAKNNSISIIEDAAESIGGSYNHEPAGSFGDVSILSFSPTKLVTGGQGGAICTNDDYLYERFQSLFHHGINTAKTGKYYWSDEIGYNFQITNFQAALINSQLNRLDKIIEVKKEFYDYYSHFFESSKYLEFYKFQKSIESNYWIYVIIPKKKFAVPKEIVIKEALKYGLELRPFFYLLSDMPVYESYYHKTNAYNEYISRFGICLPYGFDLSERKISEIYKIIDLVYENLNHV